MQRDVRLGCALGRRGGTRPGPTDAARVHQEEPPQDVNQTCGSPTCVHGVSYEFDAHLPSGATQDHARRDPDPRGSFIGGHKANFANIASLLAADGMAAFSINDRSTPTLVGFPVESATSVPSGTYTLQSVASHQGGGGGTSPGVVITVSN